MWLSASAQVGDHTGVGCDFGAEENPMRHDAGHRGEDVRAIVYEAGDAKGVADGRLLGPCAAENQVLRIDARRLEEAASSQPEAGARLDASSALGDEPNPTVETEAQARQCIEGPVDFRCAERFLF